MLETIATIVFALLAIAGAADLVRHLAHWMLKTEKSGTVFIFVPVRGHEEQAEMMLTSALEKLQWIPGDDKKVICIDCEMDEETGKICRIIAAQNFALQVCTPSEVNELLDQQVYNT